MSESSKAVFLSYAREDTDAARRIADALRGFGVEVWFDQNELRGGDTWDVKIRNQIRTCALFLPIISATTESRGEGYFRREWRIAVDRTHDMAEGLAFVMPIVIDGTLESAATVPAEFMRFQWTRLPAGMPTPEFVMQVKRILENPRQSASRAPVAASSGRPEAAAPARPSAFSSLLKFSLIGLAIVVFGLVAVVALRPHRSPQEVAALVASTQQIGAKAAEKAAADNPPAPAAPATPTVAAVSEKSIAVLPFENMSEEKDSAFFTDGMQEDVLTNLALVRELRVVSRTSMMQYRNTTKSIRQIAQELGVAYILEGSVRRSGNRVRVTGQLIHAATDEHVWAKAYDRDLTDIFAIQAELAQAIAGALSAALTPQEKSLIDRRPTENLAAYDAYAKAREIRLSELNGEGASIPLFEEAVRLDPKFAGAWAQLGSAHAQTYFDEVDHSADRLSQAKTAIDTAVRLAPDDPEVIEMLGDYYYYGYRDFTRASEQYQRLAVLRPNDAAVSGSLGFIHRRQARWGEALRELRHAVELEPRNLRYARTLFQLCMGLNLYDEAEAVQRRILALYPDSAYDQGQLVIIPIAARGSPKEAQELIARFASLPKPTPDLVYGCTLLARAMGDWETAIRLNRQLRYFEGFNEPHWSQDVGAAFVLWAHGDQTAARERAAAAVPAGQAEVERKPSATSWWILSDAYALVGDKAEALRCAKISADLIPESQDAVAGPLGSINFAQVLAWTGDKDRALAELARLLRTPFGENIYNARVSPGWWPLHGDPRFEALVHDEKNNAPLFRE